MQFNLYIPYVTATDGFAIFLIGLIFKLSNDGKLMTMEQSPKVKWYVESEIYLGFNLYLKVLSLVELTNGTPAYLVEINIK